jgi:hypothetical protein
MKKQFYSIVIASILILTLASISFAAVGRRDYAIGWQVSRPVSGLSLKFPLSNSYYLQPILALSMTENEENSNGRLGVGIRGIYDLPTRNDFHPYAGAAWGYFEKFKNIHSNDTTASESARGFQGFFGVEYRKYLLRPALEIDMGSFHNADGSSYAGLTYNLSLMYYF